MPDVPPKTRAFLPFTFMMVPFFYLVDWKIVAIPSAHVNAVNLLGLVLYFGLSISSAVRVALCILICRLARHSICDFAGDLRSLQQGEIYRLEIES
jgi:hypothetical protein